MEERLGKCALCGKECDLTFEHIPPRGAFNWVPAKPVTGEGYCYEDDRLPWDTSDLPFQNQQKGMGRYSLCNTCNSNTGSWYAPEYIEIAKLIDIALSNPAADDSTAIGIERIYPLRFVKQVLSMFCSINKVNPRMDEIKCFILNKEATGISNNSFKLCMYFTRSSLMKYAPYSVVIKKIKNKGVCMGLSEITAYPLGFVLYFNPNDEWSYEGVDITSFCDYKYYEAVSMEIPLKVFEMNDVLPNLYRSREKIERCILENKRFGK